MALFIDSNPSEPSDLSQYESSIFATAATEGIDLVTKGTVAATEIHLELQRFLLRAATGGNVGIEHVVVNDALRRWHILRTLALTFRDAYHQQLNDRYKYKLDAYQKLSDTASELLFEIGVGITYSPIRRPGKPITGQVLGEHDGGVWFTKISWVNSLGAESEASVTNTIATAPGSALTVTVPTAPANAVAWNVYVGQSEESMAKQNLAPLPLSNPWEMPSEGLRAGVAPSNGQNADVSMRRTTTFLRG